MTGTDSPKIVSDWRETVLWKLLKKDGSPLAGEVRHTLEGCMPDIQRILSKGGTAATDFTLHDDGHAFRVAERMHEIILPETLKGLSIYELAFLLLSAYLHDIGMTPQLRKVTSHFNFLLSGESDGLSLEDIRTFQRWLDDDGRQITPPLTNTKPTSKNLRTCQELITHYARARHNDWGAEWIKQNLGLLKLGQYKDWVDGITKLCQSHHVGYNELVAQSFAPVVVNPGGMVVHLRFLACVLRIADILEFDPERTPSVIFRHRDISPESAIYWRKDHDVTLVKEGNNLSLHARPSDAPTEQAIHLMVEAINAELQVCQALADHTHFEVCPGLNRTLPHKWSLSSTVSENIRPKEGTYEFINGAFRPNTEKMLQLLAGTALYGDPLVAVRELLQNAFDAVREKIAYLRLEQDAPADPKLEEQLASLHTVRLRLEVDNEGSWLVCTDNGVGMTRSIIENHVLVSGTSSRHDVLDLERRCLEKGIRLGRTGQFGIGVLSYFMICDRLIIETKRSQEPKDGEPTGWRFTTSGVGSFGELRRQHNLSPGTIIRLHLRDDIVGLQPDNWFEVVTNYVKKTLRRIPCRFEMGNGLTECPGITFSPGWCKTQNDFAEDLLGAIRWEQTRRRKQSTVDILSSEQQQQIEAQDNYIKQVRAEVRQCLKWRVIEEVMPDKLGVVRVHIPYFDLLGHEALAFLRVNQKKGYLIVKRIRDGYMFLPDGRVQESWKGMTVASRPRRISRSNWKYMATPRGTSIEVDWISSAAGEIAVDRKELHATYQSAKCSSWLMKQVKQWRKEIVQGMKGSVMQTLNMKLADPAMAPTKPVHWLAIEGARYTEERVWKPLKFPLISCNSFGGFVGANITWKGAKVSVSGNIQEMYDDQVYEGLPWFSWATPPDKVVLAEHASLQTKVHQGQRRIHQLKPRIQMVPIWTTPPKFDANRGPFRVKSCFPEKWLALCCAKFHGLSEFTRTTTIWNSEHFLSDSLDQEGEIWCRKSFAKSLNPLPVKQEILSSVSHSVGWLVMCLRRESRELWEGLKEKDQTFLRNLWEVIFSGSYETSSRERAICMWVEDEFDESRLCVLTPSGWLDLDPLDKQDNNKISNYLPDPGPDWKVTIHPR
ncbi:MAG TPA: hypothetical protein DDY39_16885 [Nitrospira sp.]|nr:hypothetical protein [Nitrospira sp.]HBR49839.1 hypothetical protein [Nitrospira sp.]